MIKCSALTRIVVPASVVIALLGTAVFGASPADAVPELRCTAAASPFHPRQDSTVDINVNGNIAGARVYTTAHYKTTNTSHNSRANSNGNASIPYDVAGATVGYRVRVDVTVKTAHQKASCPTAFTPR